MDRATFDMIIEVLALSAGAVAAAPNDNERYKGWLLERITYCRDHLVTNRERILVPPMPLPSPSFQSILGSSLKPMSSTTDEKEST